MPFSGIECIPIAAGAGGLIWKSEKDKRYARQLAEINRIARHVLRKELDDCSGPTRKSGQMRMGVDASVSAAMKIIESYQEKHWIPGVEVPVPSCSVGIFKFAGRTYKPPPDIQTIVCEDFKRWLFALASGTLANASKATPAAASEPAERASEATEAAPSIELRDEVAERTEFLRQLMMRPEVFEDDVFLKCAAEACEHLVAYTQGHAADMQTSAGDLGRLVAHGRDVVDSLVPVLVFAILDTKAGLVPVLNLKTLRESAADADLSVKDPDIFNDLWLRTEAGEMLRALLCTRHCRQLWRCAEDSSTPRLDGCRNKVEEVYIRLWHAWNDASTEGRKLAGSGVSEPFQDVSRREVKQNWLDLTKYLDNFIAFLSVAEEYKKLAQITGDAGMYYLRAGLHHILQELEFSLRQVHQAATSVGNASMSYLAEVVLKEGNPSGATKLWIERLQFINDHSFLKKHRAMLQVIQSLRFLSSEARLPELMDSTRAVLQQLTDISGSSEFRSRCAKQMPALSFGGSLPALAGEASGNETTCIVEEVTDDATSSWSRSQFIELSSHEARAAKQGHPEWMLSQVNSLDLAVNRLNAGTVRVSGDFCMIYAQSELVFMVLYTAGNKERAKDEIRLAGQRAEALAAGKPQTLALGDAAKADADDKHVEDIWAERRKEESVFYSMLITSCFPFFESEALTRDQARALLGLAGLEEKLLTAILHEESREGIDAATLQRLGRLVAHVQASPDSYKAGRFQGPDFGRIRDVPADKLPQLSGVTWFKEKGKVQIGPEASEKLMAWRSHR